MKILYTSYDRVPQPKGASVHIAQFVRALASRHDVTLLTPGPESAEGEIYGARHIVVKSVGSNYLEEAEFFRYAVDEHVARGDYDIVHFRGVWEGLPVTRRKADKGYRTVYEVNGVPSIELKYHFPAVRKDTEFLDILKNMEMEILLESDAITVPSGVTKNYLVSRGISGRKTSVIPNGVDTDLFTPADDEPPGPPMILYIGTLAPWQGLPHLLEAFKALIKHHDARLKIVGKPRNDWLKDLRKRARKLKILDAVEFAEPVRHHKMPELLRGAHIGVAPFPATERNTRQGFCPIKIIEYMAAGLPVVAPDIEAVGELVTHELEALLYKPNSMARLRDAMGRLVEEPNLRHRLGRAGRKKAVGSYTWRRARRELLDLYHSLET